MVTQVRWEGLTRVSRPVTNDEHWILYWFEHHAASCDRCLRQQPCREGQRQAEEVVYTFYYERGRLSRRHEERYQKRGEGIIHVEVELPHGYQQTLKLLRAVETVQLWAPCFRESRWDKRRSSAPYAPNPRFRRYT